MLITRLKPDYFGKFSGREIELKPGINIIYGENEAGKSTLHAFIKGMLFGIERLRGRGAASKDDIYTRYLPWEYPGAYAGQMDIKVGEKLYRLHRSFHANDRHFAITDQETGREVKLKEGHIGELIPGLNEAAFRNTISIEQLKAPTDAELAAQVRNYIANLSVAKSREVDVEKAIELLNKKKKTLEAAAYEAELKKLAKEIEEGTEIGKRTDYLTAELSHMEAERSRLKEQLDMLKSPERQKEEKLMEELPGIIEKYSAYNEYIKEYTQLKNQTEELKAKIKSLENRAKEGAALESDLDEARMLDIKRAKYREMLQNLYKEKEEKIRGSRKKGLLYVIIALFLGLTVYGLTKSAVLAVTVFMALSAIGGIIYIVYHRKQAGNDRDMRIKEANELYSKAETSINQILDRYQAASVLELAGKQQEYLKINVSLEHDRKWLNSLTEKMENMEDTCDGLHDAIMLYMRNFIPAEELTPTAMEMLKEVIGQKKREAEVKYNNLKAELESINLQIEKINWELNSLEDNEVRLKDSKEKYEELLSKQKENEAEIAAINLAVDTIKRLSETIHDSFGKELNREVSEIISKVTNGKYHDIKIDEELEVRLGWNDKLYNLNRLSAGTIDQVYFALRLAVADMLLGKNSMPLFLDDSFALYDDNRLRSALMQIADRSQVLIFSCQMREKQMLEDMGLPFNFIKL